MSVFVHFSILTLNLKHIIIGNKLPNETILSERLNAKIL